MQISDTVARSVLALTLIAAFGAVILSFPPAQRSNIADQSAATAVVNVLPTVEEI